MTAATEVIGMNFNYAITKTWATGAGPLAIQREVLFQGVSYAGGAAALTISDAIMVDIENPIQGASMTLTRIHSLRTGNIWMNAGQRWARTASAAGAYTVLATDFYIGKTGITGGGDTVTLPAAATVAAGKAYIIKDESGSAAANAITIDGNGAETIDGAATVLINTNYGSRTLVCNGSNWFIA